MTDAARTATTSTRAETHLALWMRISFVLYAGTTMVFIFAGRLLFRLVDAQGALFGLPPSPEPTERFWFSLTISMMVMLMVCCAYVARDVRRNLDFCVPIVFGKFAGSAAALASFVLMAPYPVHITVVTTDVPMGVVTLVLWWRVRNERGR